MKKIYLTALMAVGLFSLCQAQFKIITTVESIVPGGMGRSRIVSENQEMDYKKFTTERIDGKDSKQGKVKRGEAKIENMSETKLLNFFSMVGINFQNIASNDALISSKLNQMAADGWNLVFVTSAVESDAGKQDGDGFFVTRYIFKK